MAKLDLPSGGWVEYREKLMAGDKFAVQDAVSIQGNSDGSNKYVIGLANDLCNALLGRIITGWSFPDAIPSAAPMFAPDVVIGQVLDIDDYNALADAVKPLLNKISGTTVQEDGGPKKP